MFDSLEALERVKKSGAIKRFADRLFPQIADSTYIALVTDVWLLMAPASRRAGDAAGSMDRVR